MAMLVYQRVIPYLPGSKQILVMWGCRNVSRPPSPSSSAIPIFLFGDITPDKLPWTPKRPKRSKGNASSKGHGFLSIHVSFWGCTFCRGSLFLKHRFLFL